MESSDIDRGWAWVLVASVFIYNMLAMGLAWSAGVYNALLIHAFPGMQKVVIAWVGTLPTFGFYAAGPLSGILTNKYGCRRVFILGGLIESFGLMVSYFSPNIYVLYITFGILTGVGGGISYIAAITSITQHFKKFRNIATGIAVSGVGFGCFIFPPLITTLADLYSWRASMLIIGALTLNIVACGALIRPIGTFDTRHEKKPKVLDMFSLHNKDYVLLCVNNVLLASGISIVYLHLTAYAEACGFGDSKAAMLMSAIGGANLCGRFALGAIANYPKVNVLWLYAISNMIVGVSAVCFAVADSSYVALVLLAVIFGFAGACFGALTPPVLVELLGVKGFSNGYGCLLIFMALGQLVGGPFAGFLYDSTGTYAVSLYIGGGITILAIPVPALDTTTTPLPWLLARLSNSTP